MSRIDDLIHELCPNGPDIKSLGELGDFTRGNGLQKSDLSDEGIPAIHYGQIHTTYGVWTERTRSFVNADVGRKLRKAAPRDLVIATTSEDDQAVGKAVAWLGCDEAAVSSDALIFRHQLEPKFISYFFQSENFQLQKKRSITGTKVRRISAGALGKIRVPVPPAEVQREIVRILDKFTGLGNELLSEVEYRTTQHAAYRSRLLRPKGLERDVRANVRQVKLATITRQCVEPIRVEPDEIYTNLGVKWYGEGVFAREPKLGRMIKAKTLYKVKPGQFVYNRMFVTEGSFGLIPDDLADGVVSNEFPVFDLDLEQVDPDWLLLRFQDQSTVDAVAAEARGGTKSRRRWREKQFGDFVIDLPPLDVQTTIASQLSKFVELRKAVVSELEARQKQYEYYRDRLLSFEELAA